MTQWHQSYIGGGYVAGSGESFDTINPATGEVLGRVEIAGPEAVIIARRSNVHWLF